MSLLDVFQRMERQLLHLGQTILAGDPKSDAIEEREFCVWRFASNKPT